MKHQKAYQEQLASSGIIEQRIRELRHSSLSDLVKDYDEYVRLRLKMLKPKNMPNHEGSLNAYHCTLNLIIQTMKFVSQQNNPLKEHLMRSLKDDYDQIYEMLRNFKPKPLKLVGTIKYQDKDRVNL